MALERVPCSIASRSLSMPWTELSWLMDWVEVLQTRTLRVRLGAAMDRMMGDFLSTACGGNPMECCGGFPEKCAFLDCILVTLFSVDGSSDSSPFSLSPYLQVCLNGALIGALMNDMTRGRTAA